MDKAYQHNQSPGDRLACAHIRRLATHMDRSERLAIALLLVKSCFDRADKTEHTENITVTVARSFNEKLDDMRPLCGEIPTRYLAELAVAILLPEVSFIPPSPN